MKESVSVTTIFKAMFAFTLLFAAFITLTIVYNKAYKLKNESILMFEKYEGVTTKSLRLVNNYLKNSNYTTKGACDSNEYGIKDLNNVYLERGNGSKTYYYCLRETITNGKIYYNMKIFFKFNLPIIGDLLQFSITGETKKIRYYTSAQRL